MVKVDKRSVKILAVEIKMDQIRKEIVENDWNSLVVGALQKRLLKLHKLHKSLKEKNTKN